MIVHEDILREEVLIVAEAKNSNVTRKELFVWRQNRISDVRN